MKVGHQVYSYWRVSPLEFVIWWAAVLITVFSSIENGIYVSIVASLALLLIRIAHPRGNFLGKVTVRESTGDKEREVFLPLTPGGIINPDIKITPPSPGVVVYRLEESYLYPNCSQLNTTLVSYVKANMKRGKDMSTVRQSDRAWNDPGGHREDEDQRPDLRAIVLDFSTV
jgi:sodium-independent sulfate anion transporter 11